MPLSVGTVAPDFTLKTKDAEGVHDVRLSDHRGKENVVLLFYPGAYTHICTKEMCDVTEGLGKFKAANARVYGISNDSPFVLEEWSKHLNIGFPLLSDFQHDVARAYDVVWPDFAGLGPGTARAVFIIDREGVIRYSEQTPTLLDFPDYEAIERALGDLDAQSVA
ncbi:redoxin domain-containing protein [Fimbriimonas ginsengisoli]|uniref:Alkyl hydroperoxide reductase subunit C-like protein n=1 Tax=Fimbriimonas ginsengisoli Gsoil 348 TaxID=661478 RepID=A0A068NIE7_FIMGI|nr:redoxin domain-containing protein [Fimbriimonas ginsengisoli]AIE83388.1 Alkyl hydroperoxide reductase subunit C-like protein [Fimbriimonas ginsengisoli Gsoil 348]